MPELPEVEFAANLLRKHCKGSTISDVEAVERGGGKREGSFDELVFENIHDAETVKNALKDQRVSAIERKGKYLWWSLTKGNKQSCILFHFGMTGSFRIKNVKGITYRRHKPHDGSWPPKFSKLTIKFDNGVELAFMSIRRISRIWYFSGKTALEEPPVCKLAQDAYNSTPVFKEFFELIQAQNSKTIKSVLLDQQAVVSGLGNWLVDEICHHATIDPARPCSDLEQVQVKRLLNSLKFVVREACKLEADSSKFPKQWIFHHRWIKGAQRKKLTIVDENGKKHVIKFKKVGGRTTAFVPSLLRKIKQEKL